VAEAEAAQTYVMAHAYTGRAIARAVRCGVRTIEHGNLVDAEAARVMQEHAFVVHPGHLRFPGPRRCAPGPAARFGGQDRSVRQAGRDSLRIYAEHGVQMGFGSDLLGEMHQDQSTEILIRAGSSATWKPSLGHLDRRRDPAARRRTGRARRCAGRPDRGRRQSAAGHHAADRPG
jgi:imidazolonepropionase-like amidohydrolase